MRYFQTTLFTVLSFFLISCESTDIYSTKSCNEILHEFSYQTYGSSSFADQKINVVLSESNDNEQLIRLFVLSPDGQNSETTIGWLKLDTKQKKIFNITSDALNDTHQVFNENVIPEYISQCLN